MARKTTKPVVKKKTLISPLSEISREDREKVRTTVRPFGTPPERAVDPATLTPEQRGDIRKEGLKNVEKQKLLEGADRDEAREKAKAEIAQEFADKILPPDEPIPTAEELLAQKKVEKPKLASVQGIDRGAPQIIAQGLELLSQSKTAKEVLAGPAQILQTFKNAIPLDIGKNLLNTPARVREAEETFNEGFGLIAKEITAIENGADPTELRASLDRAIEDLTVLEASQKGLGKLNVEYWAAEGRDYEGQLATNLVKLNQAINEINIATQLGRVARAQRVQQQNINTPTVSSETQ